MMSAAWPSFTEAWYSPSAATIFARRSRSASAFFCHGALHVVGQGNVFDLYCSHLRTPRLGVPIDHILDLFVDARGIRKKLIKAKSSNNIADRCLADLIDRVVDVLNDDHRLLRIGNVIVSNGRDVD